MTFAQIGSPEAVAAMRAHAAQARQLAADLGGKYSVSLVLQPSDAQLHLLWFDQGTRRQPARPVLTWNAFAQAAAETAIAQRIYTDWLAGRSNVLVALQAGAQAGREVWVSRLPGGGDLGSFAPLSPGYARLKAKRGQTAQPGVASGQMKSALQRALIVIQRTG